MFNVTLQVRSCLGLIALAVFTLNPKFPLSIHSTFMKFNFLWEVFSDSPIKSSILLYSIMFLFFIFLHSICCYLTGHIYSLFIPRLLQLKFEVHDFLLHSLPPSWGLQQFPVHGKMENNYWLQNTNEVGRPKTPAAEVGQ